MSQELTEYNAGQPVGRLAEIHLSEIDRDLKKAREVGASPILCDDIEQLLAEVKRLRLLLHQIASNTKITLGRNHPRDMANFLCEVEMMTEEWK